MTPTPCGLMAELRDVDFAFFSRGRCPGIPCTCDCKKYLVPSVPYPPVFRHGLLENPLLSSMVFPCKPPWPVPCPEDHPTDRQYITRLFMRRPTNRDLQSPGVYRYIMIHIYIYVYIHIRIYIYICVCIYILFIYNLYIYIYVFLFIFMYYI